MKSLHASVHHARGVRRRPFPRTVAEVNTSEVDASSAPRTPCAIGDASAQLARRHAISSPSSTASRTRCAYGLERFLVGKRGGGRGHRVHLSMPMAATLLSHDVNTNTNYNPDAEARAGRTGTARSGPGAIAEFLGGELVRHRAAA